MEKIAPITETSEKETVSAPKPKRAYTKKTEVEPPAPAAPPVAPNPTIIALEGEILSIVQQRSSANLALRSARSAMEGAQISMKNAQEYLLEIEREVNYRMALIGQLRGDAPRQIPQMTPQMDYTFQPNQNAVNSYVSSVPAPPEASPFEVVGGRKVRSEAASRAML